MFIDLQVSSSARFAKTTLNSTCVYNTLKQILTQYNLQVGEISFNQKQHLCQFLINEADL